MTPEEFYDILYNMPQPKPVFYRLYHDAHGSPLFYSMEDQPGTYIEIDQADFGRSFKNLKVRNGKLVEVKVHTSEKIVPSSQGTLCHPHDVAVIVEQNGTYWSKQTYETN